MNRRTILFGVLAALAVGTTAPVVVAQDAAADAPPAPTVPAPVDAAWARLGEVRQDTLYVTRARVIDLALQQNEMLQASGAMTDAAAADAQGAWRAFLPQVRISEFFLRSDDALSSFGFKLQNRSVTPADFNPVLLNDPGETNNFITRFQAMMPIFNGGMGLNGKQAANAMSRAAEFKHARAGETVRYNAIQAWEGLALAAAYEEVMAAAVTSAEGHVRQAQAMVDNEMATEADLLQAKVYLSGLKQQLIQVRNMKAVAGENIKLLTAIDTPLPVVAETGADPATTLALHGRFDLAAAANRNDILARREEANAAGNMVGVATGSLLPHINASIQRDLYSQEDLFGSDAKSWSLGVYATWDVFSGMQNIGEIRKAKAQKRAAEHMVDFETRQAKVQATEALLAARAAHEKVLVARDAVQAAREGLRIVANQYREGLASMVNLLDTQAAATMAEGNLVQAMHDYRVGLANLEFAGAARVETTAAAQ
ncbi:TolC family protein [bacterium]|nr:TolC family protein [bacterium]